MNDSCFVTERQGVSHETYPENYKYLNTNLFTGKKMHHNFFFLISYQNYQQSHQRLHKILIFKVIFQQQKAIESFLIFFSKYVNMYYNFLIAIIIQNFIFLYFAQFLSA